MKKGRYHHSEGIEMPSQEKIREIDVDNGYKYLGVLEADGIKDKTMKENINSIARMSSPLLMPELYP